MMGRDEEESRVDRGANASGPKGLSPEMRSLYPTPHSFETPDCANSVEAKKDLW